MHFRTTTPIHRPSVQGRCYCSISPMMFPKMKFRHNYKHWSVFAKERRSDDHHKGLSDEDKGMNK